MHDSNFFSTSMPFYKITFTQPFKSMNNNPAINATSGQYNLLYSLS